MSYIATGAAPIYSRVGPLTSASSLVAIPFPTAAVIIGPFNFAVGGATVKFSQQFFESVNGAPLKKWVTAQIAQSLAVSPVFAACQLDKPGIESYCRKSHATWTSAKRLPLGVWDGTTPLVKTKHPETGEWWGVYLTFNTRELVVTFRKLPPRDLISRILDAIIEVISFLIETIVDLFKMLAGLACVAAQVWLNNTNNAILQRKQMDATLATGLSGFGVTQAQITKLQTKPDNSTAIAVGNAIVTGVCGGVGPILDTGGGSPWLLWLGAAGLVLVGGAVLIKSRK